MHKKLVAYCLKIALSCTVLGLLVYSVGWEKIGKALLDTNRSWLAVMYLVSLSDRFIAAFQMHTLLGFVGLQVNTGRVLLANALSSLYALILPGDIIAAGAKWANLSAATGRKSMILNAIIYNRLALFFPPLLLGGAALTIDDPLQTSGLRILVAGFLFLAVFGTLFLYNPQLGHHADRIILSIGRIFPQAVASRVEMVITSLHPFRAMLFRCHVAVLSISFTSALVGVVVFILASSAVGIKIPVLTFFWIMAMLRLLRQMPISISNLGVREGALILVLGMYGITADKAMALGLVIFSNNLLAALIGLGYQIALTMGWAKWNSQIVPETSAVPGAGSAGPGDEN